MYVNWIIIDLYNGLMLNRHQGIIYDKNIMQYMYRQVSNIRRTKPQHLRDSRTVLRLSLPNPLKPDVKSRMKM